MKLTVDQIVRIMRAELKRQGDKDEIYYVDGDDYVAVDGNPNLKKIAKAIIRESEK